MQVPFAPFDGGPIQEDSQPVLEFSGRHAFRSVDHHWERAQFATAGAAVEVWDHERSEPVQTFSWGSDTLTSGECGGVVGCDVCLKDEEFTHAVVWARGRRARGKKRSRFHSWQVVSELC